LKVFSFQVQVFWFFQVQVFWVFQIQVFQTLGDFAEVDFVQVWEFSAGLPCPVIG
jgi:hypothetical protein